MLLPTTRKDAIASASHKYFTGKPCRNGHIAERYAQSGTCQECIAATRPTAARAISNIERPLLNPLQQANAARAELKEQIVVFKVRAYPADFPTLRNLAVTLMRMRWPVTRADDAVTFGSGTDGAGGTLLYKLKAHPEDAAAIQVVAKELIGAHKVDIPAARARIFGQVTQEATAEVEEPAWRP